MAGLRSRLVFVSFYDMLHDALGQLGWFDATIHDDVPGVRRHRPVAMVPKPLKWNETVEPNLIGVSTRDSDTQNVELGNEALKAVEVPYVVDIYAQSNSLAIELSSDVIEILRGRHPAVGRDSAYFPVLDQTAATPAPMGRARISSVARSRTPTRVERPWMENWVAVGCTVTDHYALEEI